MDPQSSFPMAAKPGYLFLSWRFHATAILVCLGLISVLSVLIITEKANSQRTHILEISSGSNVVEAMAAFAHKSRRGISILSAGGAVTDVTVRQPSTAGSIVGLHGRFEILSLTGSFLPPPAPPGATSLTVFLAGGQGQVIGGTVVGDLVAVGPVRVFVSSFANVGYEWLSSDERKDIKESEEEFSGAGFDGEYLFSDPPPGTPIYQVQQ